MQNVRRKIIEISQVLGSIPNQNLEEQACKTLCVTGIKIEDRFTCMSSHEKEREGDS